MSYIAKKRIEEIDKIITVLQESPGAPVGLGDEDFKCLQKWEIIDSLIRKYGNSRQVVNMILNDSRLDIMSKSTAYKYIAEAQYVYSAQTSLNVDYWYNVLFEKQYAVITNAAIDKNWREFNNGMKNLTAILKQMEDKIIENQLIEPSQFTILLNLKENQSQSIDLSKLHTLDEGERNSFIEAIESEEITEDMVEFIKNEEAN